MAEAAGKDAKGCSAAEQLVTWIREGGGYVNSKLDLCHPLPNDDRGVVAVRDIAEGELLVLVPTDCTLHIPNAKETGQLGGRCPAAAEHLASLSPAPSPFIATVLLMMAEVALGDKSKWWPYVRSLPPACDCLLSWTDKDKAHLKGTSIEDLTGGAATEDAFNKEVAPQVKARPDLWPAPHNTFAEFCRVAGLVQSRAFHMVAENWVTGDKQEGTELFLIPGIDMINHASNPSRRNTSLYRFVSQMEFEVEGQKKAFTGVFSMRAQEDIPAGGQVLHTYGDLSDAQLLQTYGFIDMDTSSAAAGAPAAKEPAGKGASKQQQGAAAEQGGAAAGKAGTSKASAKRKLREGEEGPGAQGEEGAAWQNPFNHALVPFTTILEATRAMLKAAFGGEVDEADVDALEATKVAFLTQAGLLQPAAPKETHFVVTVARPLPDELLTVVQVLLMLKEEFEQLVTTYKEDREGQEGEGSGKDKEDSGKAAAKAAAKAEVKAEGKAEIKADIKGEGPGRTTQPAAEGKGVRMGGINATALTGSASEAPSGSAAAAVATSEHAVQAGPEAVRGPFLLGEELLAEDVEFAELVSLTIIQVVSECLKRYPSDNLKKEMKHLAHLQKRLAAPASQGAGGSTGRQPAKKKRKGSKGEPATAEPAGNAEEDIHLTRHMLAVMVRVAELQVLQGTKREAVLMVYRLQAAAAQADGAGSSDEGEEGGDGSSEEAGEGEEGDAMDLEDLQALKEMLARAREQNEESEEEGEEEAEGAEGLLNSDDSDKVGYGEFDFDDGIGEAHDRGKGHPVPKD